MPKISVITPIYQTENYLDKSLNSLVNQTLDDVEFIWIDNGASDECRAIIKKYSDRRPHIKVIHLKENIGYSGALNKGLDAAAGEYIGFCDSDDWVDHDYYEKLYLKAKEFNSDIVYTCYKEEFENYSNLTPHRVSEKLITNNAQKIRALRHGAIWDKIYKRDIFTSNQIRFPIFNHSWSLDNTVMIPAALAANSITQIDSPYYHYLQRPESTIHLQISKSEKITRIKNVIEYILSQISDKNLSYQEKYELIAFFARSLCLSEIVNSDEEYAALLRTFSKDDEFKTLLIRYRQALKPSFWQKLFSIQDSFNTWIIWILGIKIKQKKGI